MQSRVRPGVVCCPRHQAPAPVFCPPAEARPYTSRASAEGKRDFSEVGASTPSTCQPGFIKTQSHREGGDNPPPACFRPSVGESDGAR